MIAAVTADANSSSTIEQKEDSRKKGAGGSVRREGGKEEFEAQSGDETGNVRKMKGIVERKEKRNKNWQKMSIV